VVKKDHHQSQASHLTRVLRRRDTINRIIARETGQPYERVERDTDRNYWMGTEEALAYGMVGRVVSSMREL
jgi:ATP-dependent Clp protease, protease subunit